MVLPLIEAISPVLREIFDIQPISAHLATILAQAVQDPDVLGQIQKGFETFIESGQVWALVIGLVVGYAFRALTSY